LVKKRNDAQNSFKDIFEKASVVMEKLDIEIKMPRVAKRQKCRNNFDVFDDDINTYWCLSIYIPLLDEIIHDFDIRFSGENMQCFNLNVLIPSNSSKIINDNNQFNNAIKLISNQYSNLLNNSSYIILSSLEGKLKLIENSLLLNPEFKNINSARDIKKLFRFELLPYISLLKII